MQYAGWSDPINTHHTRPGQTLDLTIRHHRAQPQLPAIEGGLIRHQAAATATLLRIGHCLGIDGLVSCHGRRVNQATPPIDKTITLPCSPQAAWHYRNSQPIS
jgi:hypothetical protein